MQVMVKGADGQFYGPVDDAVLRQWRAEGRVNDGSETKDFSTGQLGTVGQVLGPTTGAPPPPVQPAGFGNQYADYRRPDQNVPRAATGRSEGWLVGSVLIRCALALVFFFVLRGLGLIIAGYAVVYAFQLKGQGSKYGNFAVVASILTLVLIDADWRPGCFGQRGGRHAGKCGR